MAKYIFHAYKDSQESLWLMHFISAQCAVFITNCFFVALFVLQDPLLSIQNYTCLASLRTKKDFASTDCCFASSDLQFLSPYSVHSMIHHKQRTLFLPHKYFLNNQAICCATQCSYALQELLNAISITNTKSRMLDLLCQLISVIVYATLLCYHLGFPYLT